MTRLVFVDTNILVYAMQLDQPIKQPIARQWLERLWSTRSGRTSVQVLNEYYNTITRKIRPVKAPDEAWARVERYLSWEPQPIDTTVLKQARDIERRFKISWWDSLIVAAAQAQNCGLLLTEDLQDRAAYGGVTVCNPFVLGVSELAAEYAAPPARERPYRPRGRPKGAKRAV